MEDIWEEYNPDKEVDDIVNKIYDLEDDDELDFYDAVLKKASIVADDPLEDLTDE